MATYRVAICDVPSSFEIDVEIPDEYNGDNEEIKERAFNEALEQGVFDAKDFTIEYYDIIEEK